MLRRSLNMYSIYRHKVIDNNKLLQLFRNNCKRCLTSNSTQYVQLNMSRKSREPECDGVEQVKDVSRDTPQYRRGVADFQAGKDEEDCPYAHNHPSRTGWLTGWYDARMQAKFGALFAKYGLKWP